MILSFFSDCVKGDKLALPPDSEMGSGFPNNPSANWSRFPPESIPVPAAIDCGHVSNSGPALRRRACSEPTSYTGSYIQ
jgi:hypothetical protein